MLWRRHVRANLMLHRPRTLLEPVCWLTNSGTHGVATPCPIIIVNVEPQTAATRPSFQTGGSLVVTASFVASRRAGRANARRNAALASSALEPRIASKLLHFARERKVYYRMDPRTTTAVETMRIGKCVAVQRCHS